MNILIRITSMIIALLTILFLITYTLKKIKTYGFLSGDMFIATNVLFFIMVPLLYLISPNNRDKSTLYNKLLASNSDETICISMILCCFLIICLFFMYNMNLKNGRVYLIFNRKLKREKNWEELNKLTSRKIKKIADITLLLGGVSIIVCILASGGIKEYVAIGSFGRGIEKDITEHISSSLLPLITLSSVILATPYLYKYLLNINIKYKHLHLKFYISFFLASIYLLYNQGRLPLILFFAPFILDLKIARKAKISMLIVLIILSFPLLGFLSKLFTYLTYNYWSDVENSNVLQTFLLEFTYPFSNFVNRQSILNVVGYRWGIDYIQWPFLIVPSFLLKVIGISKNSFTTIGTLNTNAYSSILNLKAGGGIPTDFFIFNYIQFGWISLILSMIIVMTFLKKVDKRIINMCGNDSIKIIILRICLLIISTVNNFDLSVIIRMRFDLIILVMIIFYIDHISRKNIKYY